MPKAILDPRTKLLVLILLGVGVTSNYNLLLLSAVGMFLTVIYALSGNIKGAVKIVLLYIAVIVFTLYQRYHLNPDTLNPVLFVILMMFSFLSIFMPTIIMAKYFISTTPVSAVMGSLEKMRLSQNIVIPVVIMLRFFPTLKESYLQIRNAMKMRGISGGYLGIIRHPMLSMEYIFVPILVAASSMSDELAAAAYTRGADFKCKKVRFHESKFGVFDYVTFILVVIYISILIIMRFL